MIDAQLCNDILQAVNELKYYFVKFNKTRFKEAMHKATQHALHHYNRGCGELHPYIKSLARTILKDYNKKVTPVEDVDLYVPEGVDCTEDKAMENLYKYEVREEKVEELALSAMGYFLTMCDCILKEDLRTTYFPKEFKLACLDLAGDDFKRFHQIALEIYREYSVEMRQFLTVQETFDKAWVEADYNLIQKETSKRVRLQSDTQNLDRGKINIIGKYAGKKIVRIYYRDIIEYLCDLIDAENNNMIRFNIGDSYIIRTFGGSMSVVNVSLFNMYGLFEAEMITNLIQMTRGKYLGKGSEYLYFLVSQDLQELPEKRFGTITITFEMEDFA
jgi:hypothetical protein